MTKQVQYDENAAVSADSLAGTGAPVHGTVTKVGTGTDGENRKSEKADLPALDLCGRDDFANLTREEIEGADCWRGLHTIKFVEAYEKGNIGVVFELPAGHDAQIFDLIFFAIPSRGEELEAASGPPAHLHLRSKRPDRHKEPVFVGVTELVEGPQGIIPSLVRIEASKQRADLAGQVPASSLYHSIQVSNVVGDRKIGILGLGNSVENGDGVSGLVESGPQRLKGFNGSVGPTIGKIARELHRVGNDAFRIRLFDPLVWFLLEEGADTFLKPTRVFLTALEPSFWAFEGIGFFGHDGAIQSEGY